MFYRQNPCFQTLYLSGNFSCEFERRHEAVKAPRYYITHDEATVTTLTHRVTGLRNSCDATTPIYEMFAQGLSAVRLSETCASVTGDRSLRYDTPYFASFVVATLGQGTIAVTIRFGTHIAVLQTLVRANTARC